MDQIYSYEFVKHDPVSWWQSIPSDFNNKVHFINVGVSANSSSDFNPIHLLKSLDVDSRDFVAFKLDIDTTEIEIPILFQLLDDPSVYKIVDEFFFELHYNCPVMKHWWGDIKVPTGYENKIVLDRVGALKIFTELRQKGVRAHFWV